MAKAAKDAELTFVTTVRLRRDEHEWLIERAARNERRVSAEIRHILNEARRHEQR
jgi:hypothetical protein